jgi:hypothetical protein
MIKTVLGSINSGAQIVWRTRRLGGLWLYGDSCNEMKIGGDFQKIFLNLIDSG